MTSYVVDASVAVKWLVPEQYTAPALRLQSISDRLMSPDLLVVEIANVIWGKYRRREISREAGTAILVTLESIPISLMPSRELLAAAWEIAADFDRTIYDSLYIALAVAEDCGMVTADRKLLNAMAETPFCDHLLWVEDLPTSASSD